MSPEKRSDLDPTVPEEGSGEESVSVEPTVGLRTRVGTPEPRGRGTKPDPNPDDVYICPGPLSSRSGETPVSGTLWTVVGQTSHPGTRGRDAPGPLGRRGLRDGVKRTSGVGRTFGSSGLLESSQISFGFVFVSVLEMGVSGTITRVKGRKEACK